MEHKVKALEKSLEKERVVYIMVEIRKFIDQSGDKHSKWPELNFWCNWVVHSKLSGAFAIDTLDKMEKYVIDYPNKKFHHSSFNEQFISLERLRAKLFKFLQYEDLPLEVLDIPQWNLFSKYLLETLGDCPLEKKDGLVRKFEFTKKSYIPEAEEFSIDWELIFYGSRTNLSGTVLIASE